jgi:hypothetical protein
MGVVFLRIVHFSTSKQEKVMRRIYFLVSDIETTHKIVDELRGQNMEDRHIHILAKRDEPHEHGHERGNR